MTWIAIGAGLAFGLALAMLARFFATKNERYDRVAEWAFVVFGALAVPTILAVGGRFVSSDGAFAPAVTVVGVASVVFIGLSELGSVLGLLDFRRIAPFVSAAFLGFLAWIGLTSFFAPAFRLPVELGWFGLATIALGVVIVGWILRTPGVLRGDAEPGAGQMRVFFVPMIGIVVWMAWLGLSL